MRHSRILGTLGFVACRLLALAACRMISASAGSFALIMPEDRRPNIDGRVFPLALLCMWPECVRYICGQHARVKAGKTLLSIPPSFGLLAQWRKAWRKRLPFSDHAERIHASCAVPPMSSRNMYAGTPYRLPTCPIEGHSVGGHLICIGRVVGALLAYGRRLSLPALRPPATPLPPVGTPSLFPLSRRPCSPVCANARPHDACAVSRLRTHLYASHRRRRPSFPRFPSAHVRSATLRAHPRIPAPCALRYAPRTPTLAGVHGISYGRMSRTRSRCRLRATHPRVTQAATIKRRW